jgi:hypothetical protein
MAFHRSVDPARNPTVDNSGEGDSVTSEQQLINTLTQIPGQAGIAELAAQFSGRFRIIDRQPANGDGRAIPLGSGIHIGIIARLLSHFQLEQDDRTLRN